MTESKDYFIPMIYSYLSTYCLYQWYKKSKYILGIFVIIPVIYIYNVKIESLPPRTSDKMNTQKSSRYPDDINTSNLLLRYTNQII